MTRALCRWRRILRIARPRPLEAPVRMMEGEDMSAQCVNIVCKLGECRQKYDEYEIQGEP